MLKVSVAPLLLLVVNLAIGVIAIQAVREHRVQRHAEVAAVAAVAAEQHRQTELQRRQVARHVALLEGVEARDPYVIELLARQRLGMRGGPEEILPATGR